MSEYQYIEFRAVDRPLTNAEVEFAKKQSSRAEISRWSFQNEYHFGDFRGNVNGLLRHGYDVHLHYSNYGIRTVAFRLPFGLPFPKRVWSQYCGIGELKYKQDRKGDACILSFSPYYDGGELEDIWDPDEYMDDMIEFRGRLIAGDLRALYVLWLCAALDDQPDSTCTEPPVPGGLAECVELFGPFMDFFGLDPLMLIAASEGTPDAPEQQSDEQQYREWVESLSDAALKRLVHRFLAEDASVVKAETIATIQHGSAAAKWPTVSLGRSLQMLLNRTELIRAEHDAKEQKKQAAAAKRAAAKRTGATTPDEGNGKGADNLAAQSNRTRRCSGHRKLQRGGLTPCRPARGSRWR